MTDETNNTVIKEQLEVQLDEWGNDPMLRYREKSLEAQEMIEKMVRILEDAEKNNGMTFYPPKIQDMCYMLRCHMANILDEVNNQFPYEDTRTTTSWERGY